MRATKCNAFMGTAYDEEVDESSAIVMLFVVTGGLDSADDDT